jgi:folate-dependent phosphoribosylglycinamide formyltransferase PurN
MLSLGWLSTARGQTSPRLLQVVQDAIGRGEFQARIVVVFCSREPGEDSNTDRFLELVRSYDIPLVCLSYARYRRERSLPPARAGKPLPPWRSDYDREVIRLLEPYPFDLGVLAGYMLIASEVMCRRYDLLNLHPSEPGGPKGSWQEVIWQLIEARARRSGVMMHLVTSELDAGPPVTYCTYSIRGPAFDLLWREVEDHSLPEIKVVEGKDNRLFQEIRRHGVARELPLVVTTVRAFAEGRLRIEGKRALDAEGRPIPGYDLTPEIERAVAAQP